MSTHRETVVRQFSLQSEAFARCPAHADSKSLSVFLELGQFSADARILDSGCGPGIVSCAIAPHVAHVTGVDVTPAMIELAQRRAADEGVTNTDFMVGDMAALPFDENAFDGSVTRYTVHHLDTPLAALREMVRVTRPGGRIVVVDVAPPASRRDAYDDFERRRDPSHTTARTLEEWMATGETLQLGAVTVERFALRMTAVALLAHAYPEAEDRDALTESLRNDVDHDALGFSAANESGELVVYFPIAAFAWRSPDRPL